MNNGVLTKGPPPRTGAGPKTGPRLVTHRAQRSIVAPSMRRVDNLMSGNARFCIYRRLGGLGDMVMATPICRGLKRKYPGCHVTYAVPTDYGGGDLAALLENIPYIDEVIDFRLVNRDDYDAYTDITRTGLREEMQANSGNQRKVPLGRIDLFAQAAGVPLYGETTPIYIMTEEERQYGKDFVNKSLGVQKPLGTIAVHLSSRDPRRSWPKHRVREFLSLAHKAGYHCFLFGWGDTQDDWRLAGTTCVFDVKLRAAVGILSQCDILVCPDSLLLHLGGALNMRTVSLFGAMPPACRIAHYPNAIAVVNQQISCLGCIYGSCPNDHYCMSTILAEAVLVAVKDRINTEVIDAPAFGEKELLRSGALVKKEINTFAM